MGLPPKHATPSTTFSTVGGRGVYIAFGAFVVLIALVPTTIVGVEWLSYTAHGGAEPSTGAGAMIPGALVALWGTWICARRDMLTVDTVARTLTWKVVAFGATLKNETWSWDEVQTIRIVRNGSYKNQGYAAVVTGVRGSRSLLDYLHSPRLPPPEIREIGRLLHKPLEPPDGG